MKRRQFIQYSSMALGSLSIPGWISKESLGVALVGLGYYSRDLLAPALQLTQHCHLRGVVTGSPQKIPVWQQKYNIKDRHVYNYENMHLMANDDGIDVVYIVLPTGLHAEYAIKAAEAGKHVWCEKPMARTAKECQMIIDACKKNGVKLSIGYRMQHETNTKLIMKWAYEKPFSSIREIAVGAGYYESRKDHWKMKKSMGGGAMYDMGVYPLNAARYTAGEEPVAVTATQYTNRPEVFTEVDETTEFTLEFPSGAMAKGKTSFGESLNLLNVDCRKGWYYLEPFQAYSGVKGETSNGIRLNPMKRNQQAVQMDDDARAIIENKPVLVPGEEGMKDIAIVEAIYESAASGERVIL
jgi:predicted dehydrogenase